MERVICERMNIYDIDIVIFQILINIRFVIVVIKEFFGLSLLLQFMDQVNLLVVFINKRRFLVLGFGGFFRDRVGFEVRDVYYFYYGRMCFIEILEGLNIGFIIFLVIYVRVNEYGFLEIFYRKVDKKEVRVIDEVVYFIVDEEDIYKIVQVIEFVDEEGRFINQRVIVRFGEEIIEVDKYEVDFIDILFKQIVLVLILFILFLENDDVNRVFMGFNMQCQVVLFLIIEVLIIGIGVEYRVVVDFGVCIFVKKDGVVEKVFFDEIVIRNNDGIKDVYYFLKFKRINQGICFN